MPSLPSLRPIESPCQISQSVPGGVPCFSLRSPCRPPVANEATCSPVCMGDSKLGTSVCVVRSIFKAGAMGAFCLERFSLAFSGQATGASSARHDHAGLNGIKQLCCISFFYRRLILGVLCRSALNLECPSFVSSQSLFDTCVLLECGAASQRVSVRFAIFWQRLRLRKWGWMQIASAVRRRCSS